MAFTQEVQCSDCQKLLGFCSSGQYVAVILCPDCAELDKEPEANDE